ncbi:MAG: hypothetical protein FD166_2011 [Bacteroidetes bacterium]|nr:MAG: hypothetical protein FD166_2011 [Bacteroidota bacterium]
MLVDDRENVPLKCVNNVIISWNYIRKTLNYKVFLEMLWRFWQLHETVKMEFSVLK